MNLESVRLLHAQGVPNHYIANQLYSPLDEDHQSRGSFLILFDHDQATDGTFVASLTNTLIREYYRHRDGDTIATFEHTLIRLNDQIQHYAKSRETQLHLNGTIILILGEEIHITYIGQPHIFLLRESRLIGLTDQTAAELDGPPSFSVITSGDIYANDVLITLCGLANATTAEADLLFCAQQSPLFEAARAYARILRQNQERWTEGLFIRFTPEPAQTYQLYIDRSLESTTEKLSTVQNHLTRQLEFLATGAQFLFGQGLNLQQRFRKNKPGVIPDKLQTGEYVPTAPQAETAPPPSPKNESTNLSDDPTFRVTTYWDQPTNASPPTLESVKEAVEPADKTLTTLFKKPKLQPRTLYLLFGSLIILALIIRIANTVIHPSATPSHEQRDLQVTQAQTLAQEAESAQLQNDNVTAITKLIASLDILKAIPAKNQNEIAKALLARSETTLTTLTKTTPLSVQATQTLSEPANQLVQTTKGTYLLTQHDKDVQLSLYHDGAVTPLSASFPSFQLTAAATVDQGRKIIVVGQQNDKVTVYSYSLETDQATALSRSDGKPWPISKHLASFEANFYLVGEAMSKARPKDTTYQVSSYLDGTGTITSIVNNGFAFYGLDGEKIVRLAANSPKTDLAISGVPSPFLPAHYQQILSAGKEGTLYLLSTDEQRLVVITTDGAYSGQFTFDQTVTQCSLLNTALTCTTTNKAIVSYTLP